MFSTRHTTNTPASIKPAIKPTVYSSTSFAVNAVMGTKKDIVSDIAVNMMALDNEKNRERSLKEQTIRSGIGLTGATLGLIAPPVGTAIGLGMLGAEALEMDLHGQRKMNNVITNNIMGDKTLSNKEMKAREDLTRDIVFDRCANRF